MSDAASPTVGTLFDALSHPHRRAVLLLIALSPENGIDVQTVAEALYAVEPDDTSAASPPRTISDLRSGLIRDHLVQLEACGLILVGSADRLTAGPAFGRALGVIAIAHMEATG